MFYYCISHNNGEREYVTLYKQQLLYVFKTWHEEDTPKDIHKYFKVYDYTDHIDKRRLHCYKKPCFALRNVAHVFVGCDVKPRNTYIKNKYFGYGNSLLVVTKDNRIFQIGSKVVEIFSLRAKDIIAYFSPIGNNDVPYPMIVTSTHHIYVDCDQLDGYDLDPNDIYTVNKLIKCKHPGHVKSFASEVDNFIHKYTCTRPDRPRPLPTKDIRACKSL